MDKALIKNKIKELTVLFIDDEPVVINIMKDILPMLFKKTFYALDGVEGLNQYEKHAPDVIITDLSMPKLDGISMLKHIRQINKDVKVICISGHNEIDNINTCTDLGCAYIIKPISSTVLFKAFEQVLEKE